MKIRQFRRAALCVALCAGMATAVLPAAAQNVSGAVAGRAAPGTEVTLTHAATGLTRSVAVGQDGSYRLGQLPVGDYTLTVTRDGQAQGAGVPVSVVLGTTTTVNLVADAAGARDLEVVQVVAPRGVSMVDVSSTESAMNVTAQDIARLPVAQDLKSVALLAPGVVAGKSSLGSQGISFGGSSVAENAVYIDGLNVTDFYNRVGFSSAPFLFFQEFQVKTGGYSVEFGRTTGGVINAVTKSGSNEFHAGVEATFEPSAWQAHANDHYTPDGEPNIIASKDNHNTNKVDVWASGALIKDRLFFFGLYEGRSNDDRYTNSAGTSFYDGSTHDGFWGGKLDWQITDNQRLSLLGFNDQDNWVYDVYSYDLDSGTRGDKTNQVYTESGGRNWALTYSGQLTDDLSLRAMYGQNRRNASTKSLTDIECNYVSAAAAVRPSGATIGCASSSKVEERLDERKQARIDLEWSLGRHLLRFGFDHEQDTSDYDRHYPGPGGYYYNVYAVTPGATLANGGIVPAGTTAYVRARRYEISGSFETTNSAWYLEDNWSLTDRLLLNIGLRNEGFDNKDAAGRSYIKMDDMWAPRLGFAWDMKGDGTTKLFGNVGRYFLPVANVINIKQAGGLLDERTYYVLDGWQSNTLNGVTYLTPILGAQIGGVDTSQGDGTVGDLRSEVDRNMDPVYQDEAILGFQQMMNERWSYGARAIYRKLHNAIDDMEISATGQCGDAGYVGWVMANPGSKVTVWGDTDCDGTADGWVTIDTAKEGWALYRQDGVDESGDPVYTYIGQRGWDKPKRDYKALELQLDRAWDGTWAMNASYTLSYGRGNAEGPVNSDTDFADTGRTENFDDPWVNSGGYGYLANDRRHQFKLRGAYALTDQLTLGATLDVASGGPVTGFGVGNPYDSTSYHSYYVCVENCDSTYSADRIYAHSARGAYGRLPWTYTLDLSATWNKQFGDADLKVKFAVYNVTNQQKKLSVDQELETDIGSRSESFLWPTSFQSPRYAQLVVSLTY